MIIEMIQEWFKELLIDGIISNLSGTFDTVNTKVGEIAGDGNDDRFREAADHVEDAAIPAGRRYAHLAGDLAHPRIHGTTNRTKDQGNKIFLRHLKDLHVFFLIG